MFKFLAALNKEFLILLRDIPGLIILILLPVALIVIVTVAQENAMKASRESKTKILFIDNSHSKTSADIEKNLDSSGFFMLIKDYKGNHLNEISSRQLILEGVYRFGIVCEPHDSAIRLLIDPTLQESYKSSVVSSLTFVIKGVQSRLAVEGLVRTMSPAVGRVMDDLIRKSTQNMAPLKEEYPSREISSLKPTLSQNIIPGFILFAMFFIVIPLSGSMISEKNEGSYYRLRTLPVSGSILMSAKVAIYLFVCIIQFISMVMAGVWLLPAAFGLPPFDPGTHYFSILATTIASSLAAIGFGLIVGAGSTTHAQAALFGSVMVVILAFISGTFLPIHLFPKFFRIISFLSPLRWGIDNYLDIFLRKESLLSILPNVILLLLFFVLSMTISIYLFAKHR